MEQNKRYNKTFHLIDKGDGTEAIYNIKLESRKHGWIPKLAIK